MNEMTNTRLYTDVCSIIEQGRKEAYASVSQKMIETYWSESSTLYRMTFKFGNRDFQILLRYMFSKLFVLQHENKKDREG